MSLKTAIEKKNNHCKIAIEGRLDSATAPEAEKEIEAALPEKTASVVFDLGGLDYISSAGLRVVLKTRKRVEQAGGKVVVANMQAPVAKVFEIANILMSTDIFNSVESADMYLDAIQSREKLQRFDLPDQ